MSTFRVYRTEADRGLHGTSLDLATANARRRANGKLDVKEPAILAVLGAGYLDGDEAREVARAVISGVAAPPPIIPTTKRSVNVRHPAKRRSDIR